MEQNQKSTEHDPRWQSVLARDAVADDTFVYAVKTTGIYCRPSCPSRVAKPQNVCFFTDPAEAENAGYRPCQRCHPNGPSRSRTQVALVATACRMIEEAEELPSLESLAAAVGLSPSYFHRQFKAITGLTPKAYATAQRMDKMRTALGQKDTNVTDAIYDAGFGASSRFYEQSNQTLGMTPSAYKNGGVDTEIRFAVGQCALGAILVAQSPRGICAITLGDDPEHLVRELQDRFPKAHLIGADRAFERLVARVVGFVEEPKTGLDLPLDIRGTAFQQRVWQTLRAIPPGETASYAQIAERIGKPKSVRAVARACAANKIAVAIPCHRVVRSDGGISGYRWGVDRKRALLASEAQS